MYTRRLWIAAGSGALVLAGTGAVAAATSAPPAPAPVQRYEAAVGADATPEQRQVIEALQTDAPIPVVDRAGRSRGFVRDSALSARDDRVVERILADFREPVAGEDLEYDRLFEALRVLDPVPVTDEAGRTVGSWSSSFLSTSDQARAAVEARATVAELLGA